jgi:hypothetical protein
MPLFKKGMTRRLHSQDRTDSAYPSNGSHALAALRIKSSKIASSSRTNSQTRTGTDRVTVVEGGGNDSFEGSKTAIVVHTTWVVEEVDEEEEGRSRTSGGHADSIEGEFGRKKHEAADEVV